MADLIENDDGTVKLEFKQGALEIFHIHIYKDSTLTELEDLSNYEARGMGRAGYGDISKHPVLFNFTCEVEGGVITCAILPSSSEGVSQYTGVYDIELYNPTDPDEVYRKQEGTWVMSPEVTV